MAVHENATLSNADHAIGQYDQDLMEADWSRPLLSRSYRFALDWIGSHWLRDTVLLGLMAAAMSQIEFPDSWHWTLVAVSVLVLSVLVSVGVVLLGVVVTDPARRIAAVHEMLLSKADEVADTGYPAVIDGLSAQLDELIERANADEGTATLRPDYERFAWQTLHTLENYGTTRARVFGYIGGQEGPFAWRLPSTSGSDSRETGKPFRRSGGWVLPRIDRLDGLGGLIRSRPVVAVTHPFAFAITMSTATVRH